MSNEKEVLLYLGPVGAKRVSKGAVKPVKKPEKVEKNQRKGRVTRVVHSNNEKQTREVTWLRESGVSCNIGVSTGCKGGQQRKSKVD